MMGKYSSYEKYKDSGIAWLGEVPEHWEVRRLKYLFQIQKRIVGELGFDVLSITQSGIKIKDITSGAGQLAMDYSKYQRIYAGEFGMNHMDLLTGYVDVSKFDGVISPDYRVFTQIDTNSDKSYLLKLLQLCYKRKIFYAEGQGAAQLGRWRLPSDNFNNFKFPVPPPEEQIAIARFLDYKLSKINRFIRKKKQLIQLLNEQKAAIINQAVTKGLDPHARMKDSGVEWLGEIPEHWEVRKLKYSVKLNKHTSFDNFESENVKVALENIESKTGRLLELNINSFEGVGTIFKNGDVLFGKLRPYLAKAATPNFEGSCVNEILVLTPDNKTWDSEFLKYRIIASDFISLVDNSTYGAKMPRANWDFIGSLKISRPSISEQMTIVKWIEEEHTNLNDLVSKIEKEIALVEEYKTALIAEAVTGKIDVRGYVVPEMDVETWHAMSPEEEEELSMAAEDAAEYQTEETE